MNAVVSFFSGLSPVEREQWAKKSVEYSPKDHQESRKVALIGLGLGGLAVMAGWMVAERFPEWPGMVAVASGWGVVPMLMFFAGVVTNNDFTRQLKEMREWSKASGVPLNDWINTDRSNWPIDHRRMMDLEKWLHEKIEMGEDVEPLMSFFHQYGYVSVGCMRKVHAFEVEYQKRQGVDREPCFSPLKVPVVKQSVEEIVHDRVKSIVGFKGADRASLGDAQVNHDALRISSVLSTSGSSHENH